MAAPGRWGSFGISCWGPEGVSQNLHQNVTLTIDVTPLMLKADTKAGK